MALQAAGGQPGKGHKSLFLVPREVQPLGSH